MLNQDCLNTQPLNSLGTYDATRRLIDAVYDTSNSTWYFRHSFIRPSYIFLNGIQIDIATDIYYTRFNKMAYPDPIEIVNYTDPNYTILQTPSAFAGTHVHLHWTSVESDAYKVYVYEDTDVVSTEVIQSDGRLHYTYDYPLSSQKDISLRVVACSYENDILMENDEVPSVEAGFVFLPQKPKVRLTNPKPWVIRIS